jgi:hypothetical protein
MAEAKYMISGKHDPKGVKDAKKSLSSLEKAVKSMNAVMKAFVGIKVFDRLKTTLGDTVAEYNKNHEALNKR